MATSYKELMNTIDTLIFDVDGVLTNGMITITTEGEMYRNMNEMQKISGKVFDKNSLPAPGCSAWSGWRVLGATGLRR